VTNLSLSDWRAQGPGKDSNPEKTNRTYQTVGSHRIPSTLPQKRSKRSAVRANEHVHALESKGTKGAANLAARHQVHDWHGRNPHGSEEKKGQTFTECMEQGKGEGGLSVPSWTEGAIRKPESRRGKLKVRRGKKVKGGSGINNPSAIRGRPALSSHGTGRGEQKSWSWRVRKRKSYASKFCERQGAT